MASPSLVFAVVALVMLLQIPTHLIMKAGFISAGVLVNEIVVVAGVPLAAVYLLGFDRSRMFPAGRVGGALFVVLIVFMIGADLLMDYATVISEHYLPLSEEVRQGLDRMMEAKTAGMVAWKLVVLCLVPGICEEIFFRGFCQSSLATRWGSVWAIAASSAIFAVMHGNPYYLHLYFILGVIFGWVFFATGSLWASIFCHVFNNAWTFINHVRGVEFPIGEEGLAIDVIVAAFAALIVIFSVRLIVKRKKAAG